MKKLVFSLLAISSMALGQVERKPGEFHKITSFDQIDVMLVPSDENKVVLDGARSKDVEVVNKNGELKIRMPLLQLLDGDNISATVYFTNIDAVEANEGSRIACGDKIKETSFEVIAKEGSQVKLILDVDNLSARSANGSIVELSGSANVQDILINSGGIYKAENLETKQTIITCNAGGKADIHATDFVDAKVRAGGNITIYGKPKKIEQKVVAGGNIREAK